MLTSSMIIMKSDFLTRKKAHEWLTKWFPLRLCDPNENGIKRKQELKDSNCEIRGDNIVCASDSSFKKATNEDWDTEYLDKIISVKTVKGINDAIQHISEHSSNHTESIITENKNTCSKFFKEVDSAIVLQNASTQYADGGEFGFGAEIGISTDKLHVRGPVGAQHLTSFKYLVSGNGQVRP